MKRFRRFLAVWLLTAGRRCKLRRSPDLADWTDVGEIGPPAAAEPTIFLQPPPADSVFFPLVTAIPA
jgi:hypothetical protein